MAGKHRPAPMASPNMTTVDAASAVPLSAMTDDVLLALLDGKASEIETMHGVAHRAYLAARSRASVAACDDWQMIDAHWQATMVAMKASHLAAEAVNYRSAAYHAARLKQARTLLEAADWFDAYLPPKAPKPSIAGYTGIVAFHLGGSSGEHSLETRERLERETERST